MAYRRQPVLGQPGSVVERAARPFRVFVHHRLGGLDLDVGHGQEVAQVVMDFARQAVALFGCGQFLGLHGKGR